MSPGGGSSSGRRRVAVVTGGGSGIGAAIAEELGRAGAFVVTVDPLVSVDGVEALAEPEETTAGRIVAAGGSARASAVSVTDRPAIDALFAELVAEHGGVDVVVNVAGITRQMSYVEGSEDDWRSVLAVHLDGFLNLLGAALPIMAAAGHGHVLGVTSGSGWRAADTGAYGCAKRAVAALTWELGRSAPPGVVVNAISPIAMTRMVVAAMERHRAATPSVASAKTSGLTLGARMPAPEQLAPLATHLVGEGFEACRGQVLFLAGAELAVVDPPRLLEVVGTGGVASVAHALDAATARAFLPAEAAQATTGGSNPRFGGHLGVPSDSDPQPAAPASRSCVVVGDRDELTVAVAAALGARGVTCRSIPTGGVGFGFESAAATLAAAVDEDGEGGEVDAVVDAVVLALPSAVAATVADAVATTGDDWERALAEHSGIADGIYADAAWARAVAEHAVRTATPVRFVTLTDAATAGGRSRAQAVAQHARSARGATTDLVSGFAVSMESAAAGTRAPVVGELVAHLLCHPDTPALSGAELMIDADRVGLRSHPRAGAGVSYAGDAVPEWLDRTLTELAR